MVTQTHTKILGPIKSDKKKCKQTSRENPNSSDPNEYRVIEHTKPIVQQITTKLKAEKNFPSATTNRVLLQQRCSHAKKNEITVTPGYCS